MRAKKLIELKDRAFLAQSECAYRQTAVIAAVCWKVQMKQPKGELTQEEWPVPQESTM